MACLDLHECLYYPRLSVKLIRHLGLLQTFKTIYTTKMKSFSGFPITEFTVEQLFSILQCTFNV